MYYDEESYKIIIKWLLEGSRGGPMRARILQLLANGIYNAHQIAKKLNVNYRTVTHHLKILEEHGIVVKLKEGYGAPYTLSKRAMKFLDFIMESIDKTLRGERK